MLEMLKRVFAFIKQKIVWIISIIAAVVGVGFVVMYFPSKVIIVGVESGTTLVSNITDMNYFNNNMQFLRNNYNVNNDQMVLNDKPTNTKLYIKELSKDQVISFVKDKKVEYAFVNIANKDLDGLLVKNLSDEKKVVLFKFKEAEIPINLQDDNTEKLIESDDDSLLDSSEAETETESVEEEKTNTKTEEKKSYVIFVNEKYISFIDKVQIESTLDGSCEFVEYKDLETIMDGELITQNTYGFIDDNLAISEDDYNDVNIESSTILYDVAIIYKDSNLLALLNSANDSQIMNTLISDCEEAHKKCKNKDCKNKDCKNENCETVTDDNIQSLSTTDAAVEPSSSNEDIINRINIKLNELKERVKEIQNKNKVKNDDGKSE